MPQLREGKGSVIDQTTFVRRGEEESTQTLPARRIIFFNLHITWQTLADQDQRRDREARMTLLLRLPQTITLFLQVMTT